MSQGEPARIIGLSAGRWLRLAGMLAVAPALRGGLHHVPVPLRFVLMTAFQPFTEKSMAGCGNCPPALLIRTSIRRCAAQTVSNNALIASGSRMSVASRRLSNSAGQLSDQGVKFCLIAPGDERNMRAEPRKQPGDRAADAAGAARHTTTWSFSATAAKMVGWVASSASASPCF